MDADKLIEAAKERLAEVEKQLASYDGLRAEAEKLRKIVSASGPGPSADEELLRRLMAHAAQAPVVVPWCQQWPYAAPYYQPRITDWQITCGNGHNLPASTVTVWP
jgi:hypothetical protein